MFLQRFWVVNWLPQHFYVLNKYQTTKFQYFFPQKFDAEDKVLMYLESSVQCKGSQTANDVLINYTLWSQFPAIHAVHLILHVLLSGLGLTLKLLFSKLPPSFVLYAWGMCKLVK